MKTIFSKSYYVQYKLARIKQAARFLPMPSGTTYTDIGHGDNDKVTFWVWQGGRLLTADGRGEELHSDKFPDMTSWGTSGRVLHDKRIGTMNKFPDRLRESEMLRDQLARRFPHVETFFVNQLSSYDVDSIEF